MDTQALKQAGVQYDEAVARFGGNAALYEHFLLQFKKDTVYAQLEKAMRTPCSLQAACREAHTLCGLAANLGLDALHQALRLLQTSLRAQNTLEVQQAWGQVQILYEAIVRLL